MARCLPVAEQPCPATSSGPSRHCPQPARPAGSRILPSIASASASRRGSSVPPLPQAPVSPRSDVAQCEGREFDPQHGAGIECIQAQLCLPLICCVTLSKSPDLSVLLSLRCKIWKMLRRHQEPSELGPACSWLHEGLSSGYGPWVERASCGVADDDSRLLPAIPSGGTRVSGRPHPSPTVPPCSRSALRVSVAPFLPRGTLRRPGGWADGARAWVPCGTRFFRGTAGPRRAFALAPRSCGRLLSQSLTCRGRRRLCLSSHGPGRPPLCTPGHRVGDTGEGGSGGLGWGHRGQMLTCRKSGGLWELAPGRVWEAESRVVMITLFRDGQQVHVLSPPPSRVHSVTEKGTV